MKYLLQGSEPKEKVEILISMTGLESENMEQAIIDHLTKGMKRSEAAYINNVKESNMSRDIKLLNEYAAKHERMKEIEWPNYKEYRDNKKALK